MESNLTWRNYISLARLKIIHRIRFLFTCLRWKLFRCFSSGIKVNIGCGNKPLEGYVNIDLSGSKANFHADAHDVGFLEKATYSEIHLEAFFEHIFQFQQSGFLKGCHEALGCGGQLVIKRLPDFEQVVRAYQEGWSGIDHNTFDLHEVYRQTHGAPWLLNLIPQLHKDVFTKQSVTRLLQEAGFTKISIENVTSDEEPILVNMLVIAEKT